MKIVKKPCRVLITLQHEHMPVSRDHEICCGSCGMVLGTNQEMPENTESGYYFGLDTLMVGTSLAQLKYWKFSKNKELRNKQNVLNGLLKIATEHDLDKRYAYETMRRLLKKNRGMYSFRLQMRELLEVLSMDYRLTYKIKAIKLQYELAINT